MVIGYKIIDVFQHDKDEPDFDTPNEGWESNGRHYGPGPADEKLRTRVGMSDTDPLWDDIVKTIEEKQ